jgi:hypothetical protein
MLASSTTTPAAHVFHRCNVDLSMIASSEGRSMRRTTAATDEAILKVL